MVAPTMTAAAPPVVKALAVALRVAQAESARQANPQPQARAAPGRSRRSVWLLLAVMLESIPQSAQAATPMTLLLQHGEALSSSGRGC